MAVFLGAILGAIAGGISGTVVANIHFGKRRDTDTLPNTEPDNE